MVETPGRDIETQNDLIGQVKQQSLSEQIIQEGKLKPNKKT